MSCHSQLTWSNSIHVRSLLVDNAADSLTSFMVVERSDVHSHNITQGGRASKESIANCWEAESIERSTTNDNGSSETKQGWPSPVREELASCDREHRDDGLLQCHRGNILWRTADFVPPSVVARGTTTQNVNHDLK